MFKQFSRFSSRMSIFQRNFSPIRSRIRYYYSNPDYYKRFNYRQDQKITFTQLLKDPTSRKYLAILFGTGSLFYITHLEEAPVSGRKRFLWIPRSLELKIGNYTYNSMLSETGNSILPSDHPLAKKVENIFGRIVEAAQKDHTVDRSQLDGIKWKVHIVNDPRAPPNAFVLPGGKVFVFSSILNICQNDDGLATVLSHEFAHQLARHTSENLSKAPIYSIIGLVLYLVTGVENINRLLLDSLLRMPASRQMETEADYIGLMIMAKACFHPEESVKLWQRMSAFEKQIGGSRSLEFLSTHPASDRRIQNISEWLPKANNIYNESECGIFTGYYKAFQDTIFDKNPVEPGFTYDRFQ
ncbi:metalloendopeptidase NDAI_0E04970 [Naumovozyma dairenensis CBS 421]|uniref:Peptidase M48 domain-containing protein n=1 Tax=Naumovozyma dairenensis (strain ATCC 10597 / BCRC 20456 / CBS 421 / NBRC 0211 / NRRL Y-12639) TaxID=1071378 RepID=G0WAP1_NAUDC|nr:hypothetical protein NDAI_0E04970 [Naumovozyma dairenensis CBS 421]CCD25314.1 hypothetical protein NDAI_0E04970 [Naumovozyma dairenensis CBS 421]